MPLSFSASYCFSFFTLADLLGIACLLDIAVPVDRRYPRRRYLSPGKQSLDRFAPVPFGSTQGMTALGEPRRACPDCGHAVGQSIEHVVVVTGKPPVARPRWDCPDCGWSSSAPPQG
jgi:hypothetical protein